jgi:DNA-3-methyladenine glycosylase I
MPQRCAWAGDDPLMIAYHDAEWGVPAHDDRHLFGMLILDGAQAGLSWSTILKKREAYTRAFAAFDPQAVAAFDAARIEALLADPGIVRNRLKIESAINNARAVLQIQAEFGSFDRFIWQFVDGRPKHNRWEHKGQVPASTPESDAMSKALRQRGFSFVGTTICYAFMQGAGMVNDHTTDCFRWAHLRDLS